MTQLPGPYGAPPPRPGQPYGPPPGYGPPAYPPPGQFGMPPQPPPNRNLRPWLIGGGVLLLAGIGVLVAFLLGGDDGDQATALRATASSEATTEPTATSTRPPRSTTGSLPGGARVTEAAPPTEGAYAGSAETAVAWLEAMGQGNFQTAYDLSCAEVRDAAAAAGGDPAQTLGDYFYTDTLGGQGWTSGTFDGVEHQAASGLDMASFTLQLEDGQTFLLLIYVGPELTVCDFL